MKIRIENERDRQAATQVLKRVMEKFEEARQLAEDLEEQSAQEHERRKVNSHG